MSMKQSMRALQVLMLLVVVLSVGIANGNEEKELYTIMYIPKGDDQVTLNTDNDQYVADEHIKILTSVLGSEILAKDSIIPSHTNIKNTFSAKLTPKEAERLKSVEGVISELKNTK